MSLTDALIPGLTPASVWVSWNRPLKVTTLDATVPTGSTSIRRAASSSFGRALTVTVASCPTFSLVASVSAKLPFSWRPWTPSIVTKAVELLVEVEPLVDVSDVVLAAVPLPAVPVPLPVVDVPDPDPDPDPVPVPPDAVVLDDESAVPDELVDPPPPPATSCPTVPSTAATVPATGARSSVSDRVCSAWSTLIWAVGRGSLDGVSGLRARELLIGARDL